MSRSNTRKVREADELIDTSAAAAIIGCDRTHVASLLQRGRLRGRRVPGRGRGGMCWVIEASSAREYAAAREAWHGPSGTAGESRSRRRSVAASPRRKSRRAPRRAAGEAWVSVAEAATRLGVSSSSVRRLVRAGGIRSRRVGPVDAQVHQIEIAVESLEQVAAARACADGRRQAKAVIP